MESLFFNDISSSDSFIFMFLKTCDSHFYVNYFLRKYLQIETLNGSKDLNLEFRRQPLYIVGYSKEEVEAVHIEELSDQIL
jgi:hypothetical protein